MTAGPQPAPRAVAETLAGPSHPPSPDVVAQVGPPLRPWLHRLAPSRVPPAAVPGELTVGAVGDAAEAVAERAADAAVSGGASSDAAVSGAGAPLSDDEQGALGAIRIHTGEAAERSAAAIGAAAYALHGHVVLGAPPATDRRAARRLLTHELIHAVTEPAGAGIVRRQQHRTPAPPPPPPERYDTGAQIFNPATMTTANIQAALAAKQASNDLGPTFHVVGANPGTETERFLLNVLLQRATHANWNTELDAVTQIGPAPAQGDPPRGLVTVALDAAGNATVTLISATVPPASTRFATLEAARAALVTDFSLTGVRDGSSNWTLPELIKVYEALQRLPGADRAALNGVALVRETTLTDASGRSLAGEFHTEQSVTGTTVVDIRELRIANSAFANEAISFIGGRTRTAPMSFETILHEAGHAVEEKVQLDARRAEFDATADLNRKIDADNAEVAAFNATVVATNAAVRTVNTESGAATRAFNGYSRAQQLAATAAFTALQAATGAINTFAHAAGSNPHPASEAAAQRAITARDTAIAALPTGHPAAQDFAALVTAQDAWFAAAQTRAAAGARQAGTRAAVTTQRGVVAAAHQATLATQVTPRGSRTPRTGRLQAFVDFVTAHHIPPLTQYAADNWPAKPEEFFAEAFSLWLNDPDYLDSQAPALKAWFDAGNYRI